MASASIDSSPSYFGASPKSFGASPKRRQKASASIDSSPSYFGASPKSSVTNHCKFPSSAKEPSQSSYSKIAEDTKIKFHIPDQQVKGRSVKHFHGRRKRCVSTSEVYAVKRKKSDGYVLPTKFLLGGNVFDPLNLQGLEDGRLSAQVTPDSSPFATPAHHKEVEVYIPANVHDPLNLNPLLEQEEEVTAPPGRLRSQSDGAATLPASTVAFSDSKKKVSPNSVKLLPSDDQKEGEKEFHRAGAARDEIVSPVVPQSNVINVSTNIRQKKKVFLYGNYNRYYGYRNPNQEQDPRLKVLKAEDLENKTVLDIGCNIGHITWCIARDFRPRQVTGIDIDQELIGIARKNAKYYAKDFNFKKIENLYGRTRRKEKIETDKVFPYNITFASSNYVLVSDDLLSLESPQYDTILCLSVTKWVHLNWGDEGVERLFKRAFKQLKPGGKLYLEPQDWRSYKSKKKLDPKITSNFESIRLRPYMFPDYLKKEVGFSHFEIIQVPEHKSLGFQRPIYVYHKTNPTHHITKGVKLSHEQSFVEEIQDKDNLYIKTDENNDDVTLESNEVVHDPLSVEEIRDKDDLNIKIVDNNDDVTIEDGEGLCCIKVADEVLENV